MIGWKELLIVLVIVLLVFGTKRLANLGKDLGEGVRGFKKGMHGDGEGDAGDAPRPPARLGEEPRDAAPGDTGDRSGSTRPPPPRDEA